MTPHQSFSDLSALIILSILGGKTTTALAQTVTTTPEWFAHITGPMGNLLTMAIVIWWLQQRNVKQDAKMEMRQAEKDKEDADHKAATLDAAKQLSDTNARLQMVIEQNSRALESNSNALKNHPCVGATK
jgi:E3 ubiquitin-protein ligase DOA10